VAVEKTSENNRSLTVCCLTPQGRTRYLEYLAVLERVIRDAAPANPASARPKATRSPVSG
jgi:hypothetical protein